MMYPAQEALLSAEMLANPPRQLLTTMGMSDDALRFVSANDFALLAGLISDQSVKSSLAWNLPLHLAQRIGEANFQPAWIEAHPSAVLAAMKAKPALHRFPATIARYICGLARFLLLHFEGDAGVFIQHCSSVQATVELAEQIPGISGKKAGLLCLILQLDKGIHQIGTAVSEALVDVHVRRLMLSLGVPDKPRALQAAATQLFRAVWPANPALVSTVVWQQATQR